jgi:hypothetical protein
VSLVKADEDDFVVFDWFVFLVFLLSLLRIEIKEPNDLAAMSSSTNGLSFRREDLSTRSWKLLLSMALIEDDS